jgi:hypothetical protein
MATALLKAPTAISIPRVGIRPPRSQRVGKAAVAEFHPTVHPTLRSDIAGPARHSPTAVVAVPGQTDICGLMRPDGPVS